MVEIAESVFWVGAKDPERKSFDALIPLPIGTTYNAYLIRGREKTALLDTVDPSKTDDLLAHLKGIDKIDYIVSHHAEQDHSGSLTKILAQFPEAKIVTTPKGKDFLYDLLHIDGTRVITVKNRERLSLGGKSLEFVYIPWSHWPETMASFLHEDRILFPCDLFGLHWSKEGMFEKDRKTLEDSAKRYYAEIMMPYAAVIRNHLPVLHQLEPSLIAPSHGPVQTDRFIMECYRRWIHDPPQNLVLIPYVSMHGSTLEMVAYLEKSLTEKGIRVTSYNTESYDVGQYAMDLVDAATVLFAGPTVLSGLHPTIAAAAYITNVLRPKTKWIGMFGSYGWGGHAPMQLRHILDEFSGEFIEPALCKGLPRPEDYRMLDKLTGIISQKHASFIRPAVLSPGAKE